MNKIFVYVMTHLGDPNERGCWGCENCMGQKRSYNYHAVVGVGGVEAKAKGFGGQLVWIGIDPHKTPVRIDGKRRHKVTFHQFHYFGAEGPETPSELAARIRKAPRGFYLGYERPEAKKLLALAKNAPPSSAYRKRSATHDQFDGKHLCPRSPKGDRSLLKPCPRRRTDKRDQREGARGGN